MEGNYYSVGLEWRPYFFLYSSLGIHSENTSRVLGFKASEETKTRVFDLIGKSKAGKISEKEQSELDHYFLLEHLMRLAKIRAYQMLHS